MKSGLKFSLGRFFVGSIIICSRILNNFAFERNTLKNILLPSLMFYLCNMQKSKKGMIYLRLAMALLLVELFIAFFVHDSIIRPYIGDMLVVSLIYYSLRIFIANTKSAQIAVLTFLMSFIVEVSQYIKIVQLIGLKESTTSKLLIGSAFDWIDIGMYLLGTTLAYFVDIFWIEKR